MKLITRLLQSPEIGLSYRLFRQFSTHSPFPGTDSEWNSNSVESADDFERRMFEDMPGENSSSFFRKLDRAEKANHDRSGWNTKFSTGNSFGLSNYFNAQGRSEFFDDLDESFTTTSDGMDGKLKKAAEYFEADEVEMEKEDYSFRPDVEYDRGMTYDSKDLDLRKPGVQKPFKKWYEFETTTEEVLQKADFRINKAENTPDREIEENISDREVEAETIPDTSSLDRVRNPEVVVTETNAMAQQHDRFESCSFKQLLQESTDMIPKLREVLRRSASIDSRLGEVTTKEWKKRHSLEEKLKKKSSALKSLQESSSLMEDENTELKKKLSEARAQLSDARSRAVADFLTSPNCEKLKKKAVDDFVESADCEELKKKAVDDFVESPLGHALKDKAVVDFKVSSEFNLMLEDLMTPLVSYGYKKGLKAAKRIVPNLPIERFPRLDLRPKAKFRAVIEKFGLTFDAGYDTEDEPTPQPQESEAGK